MAGINPIMQNIRALLATNPSAAGGGGVTRTEVDLSAMGLGSLQANQAVMGCNCSVNPSGLSPAEVAAAQAENMKQARS